MEKFAWTREVKGKDGTGIPGRKTACAKVLGEEIGIAGPGGENTSLAGPMSPQQDT